MAGQNIPPSLPFCVSMPLSPAPSKVASSTQFALSPRQGTSSQYLSPLLDTLATNNPQPLTPAVQYTPPHHSSSNTPLSWPPYFTSPFFSCHLSFLFKVGDLVFLHFITSDYRQDIFLYIVIFNKKMWQRFPIAGSAPSPAPSPPLFLPHRCKEFFLPHRFKIFFLPQKCKIFSFLKNAKYFSSLTGAKCFRPS